MQTGTDILSRGFIPGVKPEKPSHCDGMYPRVTRTYLEAGTKTGFTKEVASHMVGAGDLNARTGHVIVRNLSFCLKILCCNYNSSLPNNFRLKLPGRVTLPCQGQGEDRLPFAFLMKVKNVAGLIELIFTKLGFFTGMRHTRTLGVSDIKRSHQAKRSTVLNQRKSTLTAIFLSLNRKRQLN